MQSIDDGKRPARRPTGDRRPAAILASVLALLAGAALSGCMRDEPTPAPSSSPVRFMGVAADATNHSVALRDLFVPAADQSGYRAGSAVPLSMTAWNNTDSPIDLTAVTGAKLSIGLVWGPSASPIQLSPSAGASAAPGAFSILVPPHGSIPLTPESGRYLLVRCVPTALTPGTNLQLTFQFSNGIKLDTGVPVQVSGPSKALPPTDAGSASSGTGGCG